MVDELRPRSKSQLWPQRCHVVPRLSGLYPAIEAQVSRRPDPTIAELRASFLETHKVSASAGLMNKTLAALDLIFNRLLINSQLGCKWLKRSGER